VAGYPLKSTRPGKTKDDILRLVGHEFGGWMICAVCVAGARPNLIKIKPAIDGLESTGATTMFVHTGQHYDHDMFGVFLDDLGLRAPGRSLGVGSGSHA
jgi:UDP-N-acetylglucosamine 2-epimerase